MIPVLFSPADYAEVEVLFPHLKIKLVSRQLEHALTYYLRGFSLASASRAAGYGNSKSLTTFVNSKEGQALLKFVRDREFADVRVDRELLTSMLFEAHRKSASSTEEIMAIRELGKLHAVYPQETQKAGVNIHIGQDFSNLKQLSRLSDADLLKLASPGLQGMLNGTTFDGDSSEVIDVDIELIDEALDI